MTHTQKRSTGCRVNLRLKSTVSEVIDIIEIAIDGDMTLEDIKRVKAIFCAEVDFQTGQINSVQFGKVIKNSRIPTPKSVVVEMGPTNNPKRITIATVDRSGAIWECPRCNHRNIFVPEVKEGWVSCKCLQCAVYFYRKLTDPTTVPYKCKDGRGVVIDMKEQPIAHGDNIKLYREPLCRNCWADCDSAGSREGMKTSCDNFVSDEDHNRCSGDQIRNGKGTCHLCGKDDQDRYWLFKGKKHGTGTQELKVCYDCVCIKM